MFCAEAACGFICRASARLHAFNIYKTINIYYNGLISVLCPRKEEGQGRIVFCRPMNELLIFIQKRRLKRSQAPFVYSAFKQLSKITKKQSNIPYAPI